MLKIDAVKVKSLNVWYFVSIYLIDPIFIGLIEWVYKNLYTKYQVILIVLSNLIILTFTWPRCVYWA